MKHVRLLALATLVTGCGTEAARPSDGGTPIVIPSEDIGESPADTGSLDPDAGDGSDASPAMDTGRPDTALPSLDVTLGDDTPGTPPDTAVEPPPDDGTCEPLSTRCEGEILVTCSDDGLAEGRTRCAATNRVCRTLATGAACIAPTEPPPDDEDDPICEPGESICGPADSVLTCNERGSAFEESARCDEGCENGRCSSSCPDERLEPLPAGVFRVNLCRRGDNYRQRSQGTAAGSCREYSYGGDDMVYRLDLTERRRVSINVRDDDDGVAIDTVVSIRSACDEVSTQVACNDDVPCAQSSVTTGACVGGLQPRESQLTTVLDAGTWFVIVDTLQYRSRSGVNFGCGNVRVETRITAP